MTEHDSTLTEYGSRSTFNSHDDIQPIFDLYDTTMRDGEQQAGICFSVADKVSLFHAIAGTGVKYIETGMVAVHEDEQDVVRRIATEPHDAQVFVLARALTEDIEIANRCGAEGVTIEMVANPMIARDVFGWSTQVVKEKSAQAICRAKEMGLVANFFAVDATRTSPSWLEELLLHAVEVGGADYVTIADTMGVCAPDGAYRLVSHLLSVLPVPIQVHFHNDYGLATANSLEAVRAGASVVQGTFNGLGERAGNASIPEVVVAGRYLNGWMPKVEPRRLRAVAAVVADASGVPLAPNQPIVGPRLFEMESGIAVAFFEALEERDLRYMYPYLPSETGAVPCVVLGKGSGAASVRLRGRELGMGPMGDATTRELVEMIKAAGRRAGTTLSAVEEEDIFGSRNLKQPGIFGTSG